MKSSYILLAITVAIAGVAIWVSNMPKRHANKEEDYTDFEFDITGRGRCTSNTCK